VTQNVIVEREGPVLLVTFDRPEKKNALTAAMYLAATEALLEADRDVNRPWFAGGNFV
jgi:enoyl-CoA hydratase/carnithine racemase